MTNGIYTIDPAMIRIDDETMDVTMTQKTEPPAALVEGLIRDDFPCVVLLGAQPKCGKTWLALDLCTEIARGGTFLGYRCKAGKALYVNLDSSQTEIVSRVQTLGAAKGMTTDEMRRFSHVTLQYMPIDTLAGLLIRDKASAGLSVVVIDALADTYFGPGWEAYDENNSGHAMQYMAQIRRISEGLKCPVVLIHHFRKSSEGGFSQDPLENFRGSSAFIASSDTLISMTDYRLNQETRKNILKSDSGEFLKGCKIQIRCRQYPDPEVIYAWMQDGIYHRDSGEFVKGRPGRKSQAEPTTETESEAPSGVITEKAFADAFRDHQGDDGLARVSDLAEALGCSTVTVKSRADSWGYHRPKKGFIAVTSEA